MVARRRAPGVGYPYRPSLNFSRLRGSIVVGVKGQVIGLSYQSVAAGRNNKANPLIYLI